MKKIALGLLIFFLFITAGGIVYILYFSGQKMINTSIPDGFLYTEPSEIIPEQYEVFPESVQKSQDASKPSDVDALQGNEWVWGTKSEAPIYEYCRNMKTQEYLPAEVVQYFELEPGWGQFGGWHVRFARVCPTEYWIIDLHHAKGNHVYGPFERKNMQSS